MMWSIFVSALGLVFVLEGILPFSSPRFWRQLMLQLSTQSDRSIRIMGLISMLLGLLLVSIGRTLF